MKKRDFVLRGFNAFTLAERICGSAGAKPQAGETSQYFPSPVAGETSPHFPSPLAKFRTADKPASESRNHCSGSEVMAGAGAKEFQDAGEGLGVRGNKAFTLAEVLITLVIIGVIGALTVPSLIQNTQKQEYVSALKKAYSTLSQAAQQIIAEEGSPKEWITDTNSVYSMFKKHLHTAKECGANSGCYPQGKYKYFAGGMTDYLNESAHYNRALVLQDGTQVSFFYANNQCLLQGWYQENHCAAFVVDVNGAKKPNQMGRDVFTFALIENGIVPTSCKYDNCRKDNIGFGTEGYSCSCKVLTEGAMNY